MSSHNPLRVGILTSGGLAPCLSSAVASLIETYTRVSPQTEIICYLNGYRGLLKGDSIRVTPEIRSQVNQLHQLGGSPIGNSRVRLKNVADCVKQGYVGEGEVPERVAAKQLIRDKIQVLHTIGGDDTNVSAGDLSVYLHQNFDQYKLCVIGLPKTIDNDVVPVSQTLGCQTAAEQGAIFFKNIVAEHSANPRTLIVHEIMGRKCGWLAAKTAFVYLNDHRKVLSIIEDSRRSDIHGLFVPEMKIDLESEGKRLKRIMDEIGCVNLFISEGAGVETIVKEMNKENPEKIERDAFGHVKIDKIFVGQWFANKLGKLIGAKKILVQKSGYFCRAAPANEFDRNLVQKCVEKAVECAFKGETGLAAPDEEYNDEIRCIDYSRVSGGKILNTREDWVIDLLTRIGQEWKEAPVKSKETRQSDLIKKKDDLEEMKLIGRSDFGGAKVGADKDAALVSVTTALVTTSEFEVKQLNQLLKSSKKFNNNQINDIRIILCSLMTAFKSIATDCKNAGLNHSEKFKGLNLLADSLIIGSLSSTGKIASIMTHEISKPKYINSDLQKSGKGFCLVIDSMDGLSNMDANVSVGSIFGLYDCDPKNNQMFENDLKQKGSSLILSGYCLYGAATILMLTLGNGVFGFTLDVAHGTFIKTHENIKIPNNGPYYSINEGYWTEWSDSTQEFVKLCQRKKKSLRYIGSMVADIHRTILFGGIFVYPSDKQRPNGKLRIVYEGNPIAFLVEQAGGKATTGFERILDIKPTELRQQIPVVMGSVEMVDEYERLMHGK